MNELFDEKEELQRQVSFLNKIISGYKETVFDCNSKIKNLEKENAELKEHYENLQLNTETRIQGCNDEIYRLQAEIAKLKKSKETN